MKTLSEILSADPRPVALIIFTISALCGGMFFLSYPSADFISDKDLTGLALVLSGILGILFLILRKATKVKLSIFISMLLFYYLASASAMNGLLYYSAIHLVLALSSSWVFIHQSRLCVDSRSRNEHSAVP
jgi:uncharacterized membrane protein HdeD (DUF308 family)